MEAAVRGRAAISSTSGSAERWTGRPHSPQGLMVPSVEAGTSTSTCYCCGIVPGAGQGEGGGGGRRAFQASKRLTDFIKASCAL